ncbi:MAG: sensor histidine kinase [Prevotellaceae bacterium]|nr:sensor histidine kinase [Prevotellaceae bacterium]
MRFFIYIRHILFTAFLLICGIASADDGEDTFAEHKRSCDSLKNELKNPTLSEHQKMILYAHITSIYCGFALDSTIVYASKTVALAEKLGDKQVACDNYCHIGVAYGLLNNLDTAIIMLNKARKISVEMQSSQLEEKTLWLTAFVYATHGKYVTAIDIYMKLLPVYEKTDDKYALVAALCNIAELNRKLGNMSIALKYLDMAADRCNELTSVLYIWRMSQVCNEYATVYLLKDNIAEAFAYAEKADSVNLGDFVINKCVTKVLLAKIHIRLNNYEQAFRYADEAMKSANILKSDNLYIDVWKVRSDIYLAQQRYPEAEAEALKAWNADSTNINESRAIAANIILANIYMHNTEKALHFLKKYLELNRLYSEKSLHTTISDLSIKYEAEKQEMQLSSMEWQRFLHLTLSIAGLILAVSVWIVLRLKMRRGRIEERLVAIRAVLEGENKERKRIARDLHDGIGGMISSMKMDLNAVEHMQNTRNKLDKCIEDIHWAVAGMMPSSLTRFGIKAALEDYCHRFSNVYFHFFGNEKRIDEKTEITIYYCAYELVNNAIKHSGATNINVQLIQEDNRVSLTVQDNGCGFDNEISASKGMGLKNINYRTFAFNGVVDINSSPDSGTEINIEFKI